jgi:hypothetical protein
MEEQEQERHARERVGEQRVRTQPSQLSIEIAHPQGSAAAGDASHRG